MEWDVHNTVLYCDSHTYNIEANTWGIWYEYIGDLVISWSPEINTHTPTVTDY